MNDLDQAIRQSLSAEDAALLDRLGADQALHRQVLATFEGRLRWFNVAGWIAGFVLFVVASVLAWQFVQAEDLGDMLRWGAASALAFAGLALLGANPQTRSVERNARRPSESRHAKPSPCVAGAIR
jgi:hypothetical protein